MRILEYRCNACGATFSRRTSPSEQDNLGSLHTLPATLMAVSLEETSVVRCPRCHDIRVEPLLGTSHDVAGVRDHQVRSGKQRRTSN